MTWRALIALLVLVPLSALAQTGQNRAKGFATDKTFSSGNVDHINLFNGNLGVVLPIGPQYPVAGTLSYGLTLAYTGNNWEYIENYDGFDPNTGHEFYSYYAVPKDIGNAGLGWSLSIGGRILVEDGLYQYVSPDGARHVFGPKLHRHRSDIDEPPTANTLYTNDGTYLRVKLTLTGTAITRYEIEFPDGTRQEFAGDGRPEKIIDRFGNNLTISIGPNWIDARDNTTHPSWRLTDSRGRVHTIEFLNRSWVTQTETPTELSSALIVKRIKLAAFNTATPATYTFNYGTMDQHATISREYAFMQDCAVLPTVRLPLLESIDLPDGTNYIFTYDRGNSGTSFATSFTGFPVCNTTAITSHSGHLTKLKLRTGGSIEWDLGSYSFIQEGQVLHNYVGLSRSTGVRTRRERDTNGNVLTKAEYTSLLPGNTMHDTETAITAVKRYHQFTSGGVGGTPFSQTLHYYALSRNLFTSVHRYGEYGLPYTKTPTDPDPTSANALTSHTPLGKATRYLSTKTIDAAGTVVQTTYVAYNADNDIFQFAEHGNRRLVASSLRSFAVINGTNTITDTSSTDYADWDGLGHHRTIIAGGDLPGNDRTTSIFYNKRDTLTDPTGRDVAAYGPDGTGYIMLAPADAWILNTYASTGITETDPETGTNTARTLSCFDLSTGTLQRKRTLLGTSPGAADVVARYTWTGGNISNEDYFGADRVALNTAQPLCTMSLPPVAYALSHFFEAGALQRSRYTFINPDLFSRTIDANTGLTRLENDGANVQTTYNYDALGRLTLIQTPGVGNTTVAYINASPTEYATVASTQPGDATAGEGTINTNLTFDGIGRLIRDSAPTGVQETTYNALGWVDRVSQRVGQGYLPVPPGTPVVQTYSLFAYDALGRVLSVTNPDGSITSTAYSGRGSTARTLSIGTTYVPPNVTPTAAITSESYDRHGRLISVTEAGANSATLYKYDIGGRIRRVSMTGIGVVSGVSQSVTQERFFTYDNRGFLRQETHPENGTTYYNGYDARGHAGERRGETASPFDLNITYDPAERVSRVDSRNPYTPTTFRISKEFAYAMANLALPDGTTSYRAGKLLSATAHNYNPIYGQIKVTESYVYAALGGKLSERTTRMDDTLNAQFIKRIKQKFWYDGYGALRTQQYPLCYLATGETAIGCGQSASFDYVRDARFSGFVVNVRSGRAISDFDVTLTSRVIAEFNYGTNFEINGIYHGNGLTDTIATDPNQLPRPRSLTFSGWSACTAPTITAQPQSTTIASGQTATLSVQASGTHNTYQWFKASWPGGLVASGSTTYTTPPLTATTSYYATVSSTCGTTDASNNATVTVGSAAMSTPREETSTSFKLRPQPHANDKKSSYFVILRKSKEKPDLTNVDADLEYEEEKLLIVRLKEAHVARLEQSREVKYIQRILSEDDAASVTVETSSAPVKASPSASTRLTTNATPPTWFSGEYQYDGAGNIIKIGTAGSPNGDGLQNTFTYDTVGRLQKAITASNTTSVMQDFSYDAFGNITGRALNGAPAVQEPIDSRTNRIAGAFYDSVGNLTYGNGDEFDYDPFNSLRSRFRGGSQEMYVLTPHDERIGVSWGANNMRWTIRGLDGQVVREFQGWRRTSADPNGYARPWLWVEDYASHGNRLLTSERMPAEGGKRYYHLDHLGTPRMITNSQGQALALSDYYAFGTEMTPTTQETGRGYAREHLMVFTGHERDYIDPNFWGYDQSVDYMHARYYHRTFSKFLSVDPVLGIPSAPQSWNRYSYVMNNPVNFTDPSGMLCRGCAGSDQYGNMFMDDAEPDITVTAEDPERDLWQAFDLRMRAEASAAGARADFLASAEAWANRSSVAFGSWIDHGGGRNLTNFMVGVGDGASFGITALLRDEVDEQNIDGSSASYVAGRVTGVVAGSGALLRGAASLSQFRAFRILNQNPYVRIGPGKWPGTQGRIPTIRFGTSKSWWHSWRL